MGAVSPGTSEKKRDSSHTVYSFLAYSIYGGISFDYGQSRSKPNIVIHGNRAYRPPTLSNGISTYNELYSVEPALQHVILARHWRKSYEEDSRSITMLKLEPSGMVVYCPDTGTAARFDRQETRKLWDIEKFPDDINAPEVVHLEVSARCNLNCSYCYADKNGNDLPTLYWGKIIRELTHPDLKIFQLTFGGGEPFLRDDLFHLAEYGQKRGVSRTATTNGLLLPKCVASELALFDMIDVSYHGDAEAVEQALAHLAECGVKRGVIWIGRRSYLPELDKVADLCSHYEAELLMLAYKTHTEPNEVIQPKELYQIARQLSNSIRVAADGAAVGKCLCNYRFADVDSAGNLMPCSFIREPMGNLLEKPFYEIWRTRKRERECPYFDLNNHHCWEGHQGE